MKGDVAGRVLPVSTNLMIRHMHAASCVWSLGDELVVHSLTAAKLNMSVSLFRVMCVLL